MQFLQETVAKIRGKNLPKSSAEVSNSRRSQADFQSCRVRGKANNRIFGFKIMRDWLVIGISWTHVAQEMLETRMRMAGLGEMGTGAVLCPPPASPAPVPGKGVCTMPVVPQPRDG